MLKRTALFTAWLVTLHAGGTLAQPAGDTASNNAAFVSALRAAPAEATAAAYTDPAWQAPRTSWGHPSFEGVWSTDDMRSVPLSRAQRHGTEEHVSDAEFRERAASDQRQRDQAGDFLQHEWGIRTFGFTSMVVDPPDGRMPAATPEGQARTAARPAGTFGPGPFDDFDDFSFYDRCITRGVLGSILPVIYGNGVRITQSPGAVAISYEMIHDTRIIPLDGRPHADDSVRQYMGNARGYWDGDTLMIRTRNFTDKTNVGSNGGGTANSEHLEMTERLTRIDPEMIEYVATVSDPVTLTAPFTVRVMLTTQPGYQMYEYSCHEGNGAVSNALSGERLYERQVADAIANGRPIPARATTHNEIRNANLDEIELFNINAGE